MRRPFKHLVSDARFFQREHRPYIRNKFSAVEQFRDLAQPGCSYINLDSIILGYYKGQDLIYVARVRNGFVPASRRQLFGRRSWGAATALR